MNYYVRPMGDTNAGIRFDYIRDAIPAARLLHEKIAAPVGIFIRLSSDDEETLIGIFPPGKDKDK